MTDNRLHELRNLKSRSEALTHLLQRAEGHLTALLNGADDERIGEAKRFLKRLKEARLSVEERVDEAQPETTGDVLTGKSVLVVEDEKLPAMSLRVMLLDLGAAEVRVCDRFEACLAMLKSRTQPHAAVVDLDMAGRDARPIARELQRLAIPFIFHTGSDADHVLRAEFGNVPVLQKPAKPNEIAGALATVLG